MKYYPFVANLYLQIFTNLRSFKVIEVGINRTPVCCFLLVINSNRHPISYRFGVITALFKCWTLYGFNPPLTA